MEMLRKKALFNPEGDTDVRLRRMLNGNTTNLNDFNNMKYTWVSEWYRQAMNNFWIPEEINLSQDLKDYPKLLPAERRAYLCADETTRTNLPGVFAAGDVRTKPLRQVVTAAADGAVAAHFAEQYLNEQKIDAGVN